MLPLDSIDIKYKISGRRIVLKNKTYLMGIDIGSTTIKAVTYDIYGNIISVGRKDTGNPEMIRENNLSVACWIPEKLWENVAECIRKSLEGIENSESVKGVAVSAFGVDGGPVDNNGKAIYPFISWQYLGTSEQMNLFLERISKTDTFLINGQVPWYACSVFRMMWIKKYRPDVYKKIFKWLLIQDYINCRLCGGFASDYSISSTTLILDQKKLSWSEEILGAAGIDEKILPPLKQSGEFLGGITDEASERTGLKENTPVIVGGHDNLCGSFAASGFTEGVLIDIGGTFESMILHTGGPELSEEFMRSNLISEASVMKNMHALYGFQYYSGCTEWIKSIMERSDNIGFWDYFKSNVNSHTKPGSGGLLFLPYLTGSYFPKDEKVTGAIFGITAETGRLELTRSLIEGLNFISKDLMNLIIKFSKGEIKLLRVIGGIAYNEFWMQNKSDILNLALEVPDIPEATSLGLAILAGMGSGIYKNPAEAIDTIKKSVKVFIPDKVNSEIYSSIYDNIYTDLSKTVWKISYDIKKFIK
ncbi:MAG: hypothetical protein FJW66_01765 [Actinobacteria bacterium]|nr:hypothetical protein [Actinomycetota bacterium]